MKAIDMESPELLLKKENNEGYTINAVDADRMPLLLVVSSDEQFSHTAYQHVQKSLDYIRNEIKEKRGVDVPIILLEKGLKLHSFQLTEDKTKYESIRVN